MRVRTLKNVVFFRYVRFSNVLYVCVWVIPTYRVYRLSIDLNGEDDGEDYLSGCNGHDGNDGETGNERDTLAITGMCDSCVRSTFSSSG